MLSIATAFVCGWPFLPLNLWFSNVEMANRENEYYCAREEKVRSLVEKGRLLLFRGK